MDYAKCILCSKISHIRLEPFSYQLHTNQTIYFYYYMFFIKYFKFTLCVVRSWLKTELYWTLKTIKYIDNVLYIMNNMRNSL